MTNPTTGQQPSIQPPRTQPGPPPPPSASSAQPRRPRLGITAKAPGEHSTVTLDGHDIARALTGLTLTLGVGQVPTATLDLLLLDITEVQDAETRILVPDATRDVLTALGWTAPAELAPQTDAQPSHDPIEITPYLVVQQYRHEHRGLAWVVRCWGDGDCDGHLALDLSDRAYAERKAREHLAAEHPTPSAAIEQG